MAKSLHKYIRITNVLRSVQPWGRGNVATIVSRANVSMCVCVCVSSGIASATAIGIAIAIAMAMATARLCNCLTRRLLTLHTAPAPW